MKLNKMKQILPILSVMLMLCCTVTLFAQEGKGSSHKSRWEEYMAQKKEYLVKEVALTKQEQDKFFPLYDELQEKRFEMQRDTRKKIKKIEQEGSEASDEDYQKVANSINNARLKEAKLENEYFRKFSEILSHKKLYKLQVAEMKFNKELLKRTHHRPGAKEDASCLFRLE